MTDLCIIGGQQRYLRPLLADDATWYEYHKGIAIRLNTETNQSQSLVEYISPEENRADSRAATLFKSATIFGDTLYACTQTEVMLYSLPEFIQTGYISLPWFNDVHHACPTPFGTIAVAVAGLDLVLEIDRRGTVLREWDVLGERTWEKFDRNRDYRKISTKPHKSHPNFVFFVDDELWVTRFYQKDAISLNDSSRRIDIYVGTPHDGLVHGDFVYFSTVNGNIVVANIRTLAIEQIVNLNECHDYERPLGWCRGLMIDDNKLWVGFSRIRPTKLRENVEWMKRTLKARLRSVLPPTLLANSKWSNSKLQRELPTHISCYDLNSFDCRQEVDLEPHGVSAIFSIHSGATLGARIQDYSTSVVALEQPYFPST